ncbi:class I adenylate-forming enzyme family protein [Thalassobaculum sp.]|uniref:class I adenylate-forming enzyme family protein n=1 Tax=Thalassobaculum sp. TaxID=2022740 RepID=UPI0032EE2FEE
MTEPSQPIRAPEIAGEELVDFGARVAANAAAFPDRPAVIDEDRTLTWREFGVLAARIAARLAAAGVGRGDNVASLAENSAAHVALYAAALSAGACMVPLPFSAAPDALRKMRDDSGARLLFASTARMATATGLGATETVDLADIDGWCGDADPRPPVAADPGDPFNIIYSSGTTGTPKGILHPHRFRSRQIRRFATMGIGPDTIMLASTPLYSNTTLVAVLPTLALGGTVVTMARFDTKRFLALSQRHRATHTMLVPVQYMRLMDEPEFDRFDLSSYRCKFSTSAPLPGPLIARVMARWPGNLIEIYGLTEGGISTTLDCAAHPDKWDTAGRPSPGADIRIVDEHGTELPPGSFGEIVGRSGAMMQGYFNAPDRSAEMVWRSPEGDDFIRSGDMGRFDADGFLQLLDRKKDMIISGGFNIYAADLEAVLRGHPDVADVAVIAIPSRDWGETPLGLVVARPGTAADAEAIRDWANARLGKTQRLSAVELREDLPRSEIGKILKRELRAAYWG